ncbi:MAG: nuclear transport factor 2 family protein [Flavobacteriaceae bacterium]
MTAKSSVRDIGISYLDKYAAKDLEGVAAMFAEDIVLRDWKIRVIGKEKVIMETRKNFDAVDTIAIEVLSTHESANTLAAELKITLNHKEELYVVDVITLDPEGKITSIRAYLGRGDN